MPTIYQNAHARGYAYSATCSIPIAVQLELWQRKVDAERDFLLAENSDDEMEALEALQTIPSRIKLHNKWLRAGDFDDPRLFHHLFGFTQTQFARFANTLRLPPKLEMRDRGRRKEYVPTESALLLALYWFRKPRDFDGDAMLIFGFCSSSIHRAKNAGINVLYTHAWHCTSSREAHVFLLAFTGQYERAIAARHRAQFGVALERAVIGYIDGTHMPVARPSEPRAQSVIYDGYRHTHCVQYQGLAFPNGMSLMSSGVGGHDTDTGILIHSDSSVYLTDTVPRGCCFIGDEIYPASADAPPWLWSERGKPREQVRRMAFLRGSIEHLFGHIVQQWQQTGNGKNLFITRLSAKRLWTVAAFLSNVQNVLQPNQVSQEHKCAPMFTLEQYLRLSVE